MCEEIENNKELLNELLNEIEILYFAGADVKEVLRQVKENLKK